MVGGAYLRSVLSFDVLRPEGLKVDWATSFPISSLTHFATSLYPV
jgi:hypothetical protein